MNSSMLLATPNWLLPVIIGVIILVVIVAVFIMVPVKVWFQALVSGAHVSMTRLIVMKLRKVDYKKLVKIYIISQKAGLRITISDLETHLMAGGNIDKVVDALIAAHSAKLELSIQQAKAMKTEMETNKKLEFFL